MPKVTINLNAGEISRAIDQLSQREKTLIVKKLEKETRTARFNQLLKRIRERARKSPLEEQAILQEVETIRQQRYDQSGH